MLSRISSLLQFYKKDIHIIKYASQKKSLHMTGASCLGNIVIGTAKMILGIVSLSFFTCASAMYTYAIVIAKVYVIYGISQTQDFIAKQYDYYQRSGKLLVIAGFAYMIYSLKLIIYPTTTYFDQNKALTIALFTFVELGLNIRGMIIEKKNKMPLFHALKIINLASSCICLVLTQTALLAYTSVETGIQHSGRSNGLIGILMGGVSTLLGVYLVVRANRMCEGKDMQRVCRKIRKIINIKNESFFEPIQFIMNDNGERVLVVQFDESLDNVLKKQVCNEIFKKLNIVMIDKNDTIKERKAIQ